MAYITLDKNAFFHNLDIITQQTKSIDKISLVLKDNAYGHGLSEIATLAAEYGIKRSVVRDENEAMEIEQYFDEILILAPKLFVENSKYIYTINDLSDIDKVCDKTLSIALKVDSGMHRNGIEFNELENGLEKIEKSDLNLHSVFTHFRSADVLSSEWFWQNKNYHDIKTKVREVYSGNVLFHSQNSAALFRSEIVEDIVRVGIAAYGCLQMDKTVTKNLNLKPILSLWAEKISTKKLTQNSRVGYDGTGVIKEEVAVVSNYDIGYADGFLRTASSNFITPNSEEIVGRVSMDNSSFKSDKEVILLFDDARKASEMMGTISYELLVRLNQNIKRVVI